MADSAGYTTAHHSQLPSTHTRPLSVSPVSSHLGCRPLQLTWAERHSWFVYLNTGQGNKGRGELDVSGETKEETNSENSRSLNILRVCKVCQECGWFALLTARLTPVGTCMCVHGPGHRRSLPDCSSTCPLVPLEVMNQRCGCQLGSLESQCFLEVQCREMGTQAKA